MSASCRCHAGGAVWKGAGAWAPLLGWACTVVCERLLPACCASPRSLACAALRPTPVLPPACRTHRPSWRPGRARWRSCSAAWRRAARPRARCWASWRRCRRLWRTRGCAAAGPAHRPRERTKRRLAGCRHTMPPGTHLDNTTPRCASHCTPQEESSAKSAELAELAAALQAARGEATERAREAEDAMAQLRAGQVRAQPLGAPPLWLVAWGCCTPEIGAWMLPALRPAPGPPRLAPQHHTHTMLCLCCADCH